MSFKFQVEMKMEECCSCGIVFAMTKDFQSRRLKDHKTFYCPSGHNQHYIGETKEQKLRRQLERAESSRDWYKNLYGKTDRSLTATKGHLTRLRNKIKQGECPNCDEHFQDVEEHMKSAHPELYARVKEGAEN